jgi:hypothetical protein
MAAAADQLPGEEEGLEGADAPLPGALAAGEDPEAGGVGLGEEPAGPELPLPPQALRNKAQARLENKGVGRLMIISFEGWAGVAWVIFKWF